MTPQPTTLIGIKLPHKTSNVNEQAMADCGSLWQKFEQEGIFNKVPGKTAFEIYAVYYNYEGDHTQPYSYFIGCPVAPGTEVPEGLQTLEIPAQNYTHINLLNRFTIYSTFFIPNPFGAITFPFSYRLM